ncbi:MAG: hypothetical protein ACK5NF_06900 [Bacilli bacterium]
MEILIVFAIAILIIIYRQKSADKVYKFFSNNKNKIYSKYAPYSYKEMSTKIKELGTDFSKRDFLLQCILIATFMFGISYLYFYNIIISIIYASIATLCIPFFAYLRTKRLYNEFLFEQVQIYTTNVIMEFQITKSFVKSLEGVYQSGIIEDPIASDIKTSIMMAYENGTIEQSIEFMNEKYQYNIVKNMHQMFLQITKEGAHETDNALDNMLNDIDLLVESVYKDKLDRAQFHRQFLQFGIMLYLMVMLIQVLVGTDAYIDLLKTIFAQALLHVIIIVNSFFLLRGEKFYNENVGAE